MHPRAKIPNKFTKFLGLTFAVTHVIHQYEKCEEITGGWQIWGEAPQAPRGEAWGCPLPQKIF